jgi:transposase
MTQQSRQDRQRAREAERRRRAQAAGAVVGVDAGKYRHGLVVRPAGGVDSRPLLFPTTREGFQQAEEFILRQAGGITPEQILVGIEFAGVYGHTLAHYLHARGFQVVSVLPAHTKAWKEVAHGQRLKTDAKDALSITALVAQGNFVTFPFLRTVYAELRHLVSARERRSLLRSAALTRLKSTLQVTWPEYEGIFTDLQKPTAVAVLRAFSGPQELLAAPRAKVLRLLQRASRGQMGEKTYEKLHAAAEGTLALPGSLHALRDEVKLLLKQIAFYTEQIKSLEASMVEAMMPLPEGQALRSIPGVAPVAAAVFLGSLGDPQAYHSSRQVLKLAGLSLIEHSSGTRTGAVRISKSGRPLLRRLAFMLGLRAVRSDGIYRKQFEALVSRNGGKKLPAVLAIGRRMLKLMFSVARHQRSYTPESPGREGQIAA